MSGPAGRTPGKWVIRKIRGGDLFRAVRVPPGKVRGRCLVRDCGWPGPAGTTPHNISRELMRHTRRTGHQTSIVTVQHVVYVRPREEAA